jgi:starch-binding outer membrane protein SusE/F
MKKILTKFLAIGSIALFMLPSCKKDGALVTSNGGKPGALTANVSTLVLDKTKLNDTTKVINFTFTKPDFGYSAAVTNTLQIDISGDNWVHPASATLGVKTLSQGYSTGDFNALLLKLNLVGGVTSQVQVRVQHTLSADVAPVYSNVLSLTVTPFNLSSWLYVVGQFNGYSATAPDSLLSATGNGIYTGIINFPVGQPRFLILPAKSYDNKYATNASPVTSGTSVTYPVVYVASGGSDLYSLDAGGQEIITLNTNTNTITITPANYYSVIGTVTPGGDFSSDVDLKFVNSTNQDWEAVIPMTYGTFPGGFKIRQDHDWQDSWGTIASPDGISLTDASGGNIPVPSSGNYKVTFTIPVTTYSLGTAAAATATYTLKAQ